MSAVSLSLSPEDRARLAEVEKSAARGPAAVSALIAQLDTPSWAVRREVVAALARLGAPAVQPLCDVLRQRRDSEARVAAAVEALVATLAPVDAAVAALAEDPNPAVVYDAAQVLGRRMAAESVPLLARLVGHADDNVAVAAIEALGRMGGAGAVDALIRAAGSGNFFRTFPAIDVLGRSGDPRAAQQLVQLVDQPLFAAEAARALGRAGDERGVSALVALVSRSSGSLVRIGAVALAEVHAALVRRSGSSQEVPRALQHASHPEELGRRLRRALDGADIPESVALCQLLGWVGGADAVEALLTALDGEPAVAHAAAAGLGALGAAAEPQVLDLLRSAEGARRLVLLPLVGRRGSAASEIAACLQDRDPAVRALACEVLAKIGSTSVVSALFGCLADPDARVSQAATAAIQSLGSAETEALARKAATASEQRVRRAALRIIAYFGYPRALDVLLASLADGDERVREAAVYGLAAMEDARARAALLATARHPAARTRAAAMRALGHGALEPEVSAALHAGLADGEAWVRYYACQSLGKLSDESALGEIAAHLEDPAGQVQVAAVEALSRFRAPVATQALFRAAASGDPDVQRAALLGLSHQPEQVAVPILVAALKLPDASTRLVAVSSLSSFASPEVLGALARAAEDVDSSVRSAALGILSGLPGAAPTRHLIALAANEARRVELLPALARPVEGRIPGLVAALQSADEALAPVLVAALVRMDRADALAALMDALEGAESPGRRAAASALARLSGVGVKAALAHAASVDPDPEVQRLCAEASRA